MAALRFPDPCNLGSLFMIEFLRTAGAIDRIERMIDDARERVVLISPFVKLTPQIAERLQEAGERGVAVTFVYGKTGDLAAAERTALEAVKGLRLRYYEELHAKCYFSERELVLTSMNLYQASRDNREMGVYVTADEAVYAEAVREAEQIVRHAVEKELGTRRPSRSGSRAPASRERPRRGNGRETKRHRGHCLRCRSWIPLDPLRPLCDDCFDEWRRSDNQYSLERWCHDCGEASKTRYIRPVCRKCYPAHREALQVYRSF